MCDCINMEERNLPENLMMILDLLSCSPRGFIKRAMDSPLAFLAASGCGHLLKNFHSNGIAALPDYSDNLTFKRWRHLYITTNIGEVYDMQIQVMMFVIQLD